MKNIVEIKNVRNVDNNKEGSIYLIGSVDKEAFHNDCAKYYGLSVFFRHYEEGEKAQYVKSFVLSIDEMKLLRRGKINIVRDIGYILTTYNTTLDIICLGSSIHVVHDQHFSTQKVDRATFELLTDGDGYNLLVEESQRERHEMCGFRLAISKALNTMLNITEDSIVPSLFPGEANVVEMNYNKSLDR